MQVYEYSCDCWDYECYPKSRFASEYGWQSYSSLPSFAEMIDPSRWYYWNESIMRREKQCPEGHRALCSPVHIPPPLSR